MEDPLKTGMVVVNKIVDRPKDLGSHYDSSNGEQTIFINESDFDEQLNEIYDYLRNKDQFGDAKSVATKYYGSVNNLTVIDMPTFKEKYKQGAIRHEYEHLRQNFTVLSHDSGTMYFESNEARVEWITNSIYSESHWKKSSEYEQLKWNLLVGTALTETQAIIQECCTDVGTNSKPSIENMVMRFSKMFYLFDGDRFDSFIDSLNQNKKLWLNSKYFMAMTFLVTFDPTIFDGSGSLDSKEWRQKVVDGLNFVIDNPDEFAKKITEPNFMEYIDLLIMKRVNLTKHSFDNFSEMIRK